MKIKDIHKIIKPYIIDKPMIFEINKVLFDTNNGRKEFNNIIRENVKKKYGVYAWVNELNDEIVYIGMAGKLKTDGTYRKHTICDRLKASRGKDKITMKDITTNDHVFNFMNKNKIKSLKFYIMYSKPLEPPSYIEALMLYHYFKKNNKLPILNNSF